ncbi:MAG: hypothetical protein MUF75_03295 [Bacteroidia bacterium]|jgi:hypothetical protein|nr:hypothetical protein [Bacteroidia bacterium]
MSSSIAKAYTDAVKYNQKILYGVWEPGFNVKLGDFGVMNGNIFVQQGNISELDELSDFEISYREDDTSNDIYFTSGKEVEVDLKGKGTVSGVPVNASIDISFSREKAVFFNAAGCTQKMIENKYQLGQKLLGIYKKDKKKWRREFVVVTDVISARRALIVISTSSNSSISLEAEATIPQIDLANASLGLSIKNQKSSCYKVVTEQGLIPLIGLAKIQSSFLWFDKDFKPMKLAMNKPMLETIKDSDRIKTEASDKDIHFGQYTEDL